MSSEREEALSWAGDSDNGLIEFDPDAVVETEAKVTVAPVTAAAAQSSRSTGATVMLGVFVGIYALYVAGWALFIFSHPVEHFGDLLPAVMYELGESLAIVAPIFWFFAVLVTVDRQRVGLRMLWLAIGALVLIPWPFLLSAVLG